MRHEDVCGYLDERWKGREPAVGWSRLKRPLLRVEAVLLLLQLLRADYEETGFSSQALTLINEAVEQICRNMVNNTIRHCTAAYLKQIVCLWQQLPSICVQA